MRSGPIRFARTLAGFCIALLAGCATQVVPPVAPADPTTVYLCDYGIHSSLLLPNGDGRFVEYVYGDWDYAALNKSDLYHTAAALFFSPQPALGRRFLTAKPGEKFPFPPNAPKQVQPAVVNGDRVAVLVADLDARYARNRATEHLNSYPNYNFVFVKDQEAYGIFNDCNKLTSRNLQALGCEVHGLTILSNFEIKAPGDAVAGPGSTKLR